MSYIDRVLATNPLAFYRLTTDGPPDDLIEGQTVIDATGNHDGVAHPEGGDLDEQATEAAWLTCREDEADQLKALFVVGPNDPHITVSSSDFQFLNRDPFTVIFCLTDCYMQFIGVAETAGILGTDDGSGGWSAYFYATEEDPPEGIAVLHVAFVRDGDTVSYLLNVRTGGGDLLGSARIYVVYNGTRLTMWAQSATSQPVIGAIQLDPIEQVDTTLSEGDLLDGGDLLIASQDSWGTMGIAPLSASLSHVIIYDRALTDLELAYAASCEFGPVFLSGGVSPA